MKRQVPWRSYLGNPGLYWETIRLALPISVQSLIGVGMNLIDTVMLGTLGDAQISAASLAGQYVTLFLICTMGLAMGAGVLTTRYWGMGKVSELKKAVTLMLRWELLVTLLFTGGTWLWAEKIMGVFTRELPLISYGSAYLRWLLPAYAAMAFSQSCTIVLRSTGNLAVPLFGAAAALGLNGVLNWVFIHGNLGMPAMGIEGAGLATALAWELELVVICGYFFFLESGIGYRIRDLKQDCSDFRKDYFRICLPVLVSDGLLGLGNSAASMVMARMGQVFAAGNSVTMVAQQLSAVLHHGIAGASGIITGRTLGQGDYEAAQRQGYCFVLVGVVAGLAAALGIFLLRPPVIAYYQVSVEAKTVAWDLMNGILLLVVFQSVSGVLTKGVLRAGGDTRFLMVGDVLFLWMVSIPLGTLAGLVWRLPVFWVYVLLKADLLLKCLWCLLRLHSGKWRKQIKGSA